MFTDTYIIVNVTRGSRVQPAKILSRLDLQRDLRCVLRVDIGSVFPFLPSFLPAAVFPVSFKDQSFPCLAQLHQNSLALITIMFMKVETRTSRTFGQQGRQRPPLILVTSFTFVSQHHWSLCTLYLHACQMRVTVDDSGLCCTCVTYFAR